MSTATHHDADIVLKIYELRRDDTMRKARSFIALEFWPRSADEIIEVMNAFGTEKNTYFRQVISFCEMAVTLPLSGAVHSDLFSDWNGEILFIYAKYKPFLEEIRKKTSNPGFFGNVERYVQSSPHSQKKLEAMIPRAAKMAEEVHAKK